MDKEKLLQSAEQLVQPSAAACEEYAAKSELLNSQINMILLNRKDITTLIGDNTDMMKDNHANHIRFMASVFENYEPEVLVDTVLWVFRAYRSHGFSSNYWASQMNAWMTLLKAELSPSAYQEIIPFYHWMQVNIPLFVILSDKVLDSQYSKH